LVSVRCIAFDLVKDHGAKNYNFRDDVYARISEYCKLPVGGTVEDLMACRLNSDKANVRAVYDNQMSSKHPLQHGFTTTDRVGFFDNLIEPLAKVGVVPWRDWEKVSSKPKIRKPKRSNFKISALLKALADDPEEKLVDEEKVQELLEEMLRRAFSMKAEDIADKLTGKDKAKGDELEKVMELNFEAVKCVFGDDKPTLVIVGENSTRKKIIDRTINLLFGNSLETHQARLPDKAYGVKPKDIKRTAHIQAQVAIWSGIINTVREVCSTPILALAESPMWFSLNGKSAKDSPLNKTAARMAWAEAGIPLQYLNPPELKSGKIRLNDYLFRIQSALYDLIFAHNGYTEAVPESAEALFTGKMAERKPKYVVGLSVLYEFAFKIKYDKDNFQYLGINFMENVI